MKRQVENVFIFPFILLGRIIGTLTPLKKEYKIYFFFPFYHIGGAEKLHLEIVKAVADKDCIIFFTKKSVNTGFLEGFKETNCTIKYLSAYTDNKWLYFLNLICRGVITTYINSQKSIPVVFNGQSNFGYKISPWLNKKIPQLELIHALNTFSYIRLPFIEFYIKSITVSQEVIQKHQIAYSQLKVPHSVWCNFTSIMSRVILPKERVTPKKFDTNPLQVLYVGRDSFEKRPYILSALAKNLAEKNIPVQVLFAGSVEQSIPNAEKPYCIFLGDINTEDQMHDIYLKSHFLVIPSSSESGPLVFMEAMARGLIIISTPVGYIPLHIQNGISGFITSNLQNENDLINEIEEMIIKLVAERSSLQQISAHNIRYAYDNFDIKYFVAEYRNLIQSIRTRK